METQVWLLSVMPLLLLSLALQRVLKKNLPARELFALRAASYEHKLQHPPESGDGRCSDEK